ncbi:MAG: ribosome maturation factor RimP [Erysipelotrichaceae bacterium]|nr:ribosome maturation factor RimP [Erysipelotrichaceae bacterium]
MTKHEKVEKKTEELAVPILQEQKIELVDIEYVKEAGTWYLRVYIDKEGGVTILDCETVSRALSDALDADDPTDDAYVLEVSSPGLGRAIRKEKDLVRNLNRPVEIHLYQAVEKEKDWVGELKAFDKDTVTILVNEKEQTLERKNISKMNEYVEW